MAAVPPNVEVSIVPAPTTYRKTILRNLWLGRTGDDTQKSLLEVAKFGHYVVVNWTVFEGEGNGAKLVARGQGSTICAGSWISTYVIVFVDGRFKGSTLQVMGNALGVNGQLAVTGGTGEFALASGIIKVDFDKLTGVDHLTVEVYTPVFLGPCYAAAEN
ncbi:dirigent protein 6-like [Triticum dicoccoides]|uniref:dirigent protein 6-like n=1 Tax=Triticum dicoccoides TaxID=85692 RepID=UPI001233913A|nr:dirigent protein 6-like [Triticum dicoccoides]XP_037471664.1 dirigent protein 6-like [Triticum dicoccoides]XP_037471665.1 dirigent protein 6-like [Triticum dicoccoides]XP_037471666.1 dirigent protein 6-like [Triticum dicoccoides]XP_037471667.1 dirigent protein 6-like isoform X1 [Triticum dicoccoides]XP_037471668.1 dirigent protein 6-like isoform X2 [Triticum dicoccoides]XP_037471669.1 dirigent protein 6-like [Triticum dicoccoides]